MSKVIRRSLIAALVVCGFYVMSRDLFSNDMHKIAIVVVVIGVTIFSIWRDVKTAPAKQAQAQLATRNKDKEPTQVTIVDNTYWTCPSCNDNNPEWRRICRACEQPVFIQ